MFATLFEAQRQVSSVGFVGCDDLLRYMVYQSGSGVPSANSTFVGEQYLDTGTGNWYKSIAIGTGAADWIPQGIANLDATEFAIINGVTAGTVEVGKAIVPTTGKVIDTLDITTLKNDGIALSPLICVDVAVTAALLDAAGTAPVIVGGTGDQFKVRGIILHGGGTNFAAGGNRLIDLTDGTTVYTQIANADIEAAPAASLPWGNAKVPMLTGKSNVATVAGSTLRFQYSGGTTDHSATGSISFNVLLQKVA